ncbi:hypothetical protein ACEWY4_000208 [Coilia grayii]|uniref:SCAN box domain-containing protein n=1 Tax=Coilia grayii TaxID=363190 RepID=A0ABD1KW05_9TELE
MLIASYVLGHSQPGQPRHLSRCPSQPRRHSQRRHLSRHCNLLGHYHRCPSLVGCHLCFHSCLYCLPVPACPPGEMLRLPGPKPPSPMLYLTGKARNAYVAMDINESMDYIKVTTILQKYEINEEVYRRRFREPDIWQGESPRELYQCMKDMFRKWIGPEEKTVKEVAEVLILEQFVRTLSVGERA